METVAFNTTLTSFANTLTPGNGQPSEVEIEHSNSLAIFFALSVLIISIFLIHFLIHFKFHYLPESISVVFLGGVLGLILKTGSMYGIVDLKEAEMFSPTMFFLIFLPPIIFESGYSLHKGNFFQNLGSILVFAIFGTAISAIVIGFGVYILGVAGVVYKLNPIESFAFGSLVSAVDPVATLAIFRALNVDEVLYMLVFGESVLNDAVAIVMTTTILMLGQPGLVTMSTTSLWLFGLKHFCIMFFASALMGTAFGLVSAILSKYIDLRETPSLEFGFILIFSYLPYVLAESVHLSGIMAVLFGGITMSHYTHFNLSPMTQITVQQTFRTASFLAENCVFAYLGLAIFSYRHRIELSLVVWSIILILISRACNIFPLSILLNFFRDHKITKKMQAIMWFSGLRGAIAFALSLHMDFSRESRHVIITTTLIVVLFTTLFLGGGTMPLMQIIGDVNESSYLPPKGKSKGRRKHRKRRDLTLSKTEEMGHALDSEQYSEMTESEMDPEVGFVYSRNKKGFMRLDEIYLKAIFIRQFTPEEIRNGKVKMRQLANQWFTSVRRTNDEISDDEEEVTLLAQEIPSMPNGGPNSQI